MPSSIPLRPRLQKIIVPAPFGNYFYFSHTTNTVGTYTRERRAGWLKRLWRVLYTLRPYPALGAWVNRLGLPNPGIDHFAWTLTTPASIISITARNDYDWAYLLWRSTTLMPLAIELNLSCPNTTTELDHTNYGYTLSKAVETNVPIIAKLPPVGWLSIFNTCQEAGIKNYHCCNTLPTPAGGLSGKPLKSLSLEVCRHVAKTEPDVLIGGGGITCLQDIRDYYAAGATNFSIGSALLNPFRWRSISKLATWMSDNWESQWKSKPGVI